MHLAVGSTLPITVQLSDQNTTRTIRARVLDDQNVVIYNNIPLPHVATGFYANLGYVMLDVPYVTIVYEIMNGMTVLLAVQETIYRASDRELVEDLFIIIDLPEIQVEIDALELTAIPEDPAC